MAEIREDKEKLRKKIITILSEKDSDLKYSNARSKASREVADSILSLLPQAEPFSAPRGATCHVERDNKGEWWLVWGADFPQDEPGRKPHPESVFLEDAYQRGLKGAGEPVSEDKLVEQMEILLFDESIKGEKVKKNITDLSKDLISLIRSAIEQELLSQDGVKQSIDSIIKRTEQEARKQVLREIVSTLDIHEDEMGFCEISNHVPYHTWQSLSKEASNEH